MNGSSRKTWKIGRSPLPKAYFICLAPVIPLILVSLILPPDSALRAVAPYLSLAIPLSIIAVLTPKFLFPKFTFDDARVVEHWLFAKTAHLWENLERLEGSRLIFSSGFVDVLDRDMNGSRLLAEAKRRLGLPLHENLTVGTPTRRTIRFIGTLRPDSHFLRALLPSVLFPFILLANPKIQAGLLAIVAAMTLLQLVSGNIFYRLDNEGIRWRWMGLLGKGIRWEDVDFVTTEASMGARYLLLWSGPRVVEFEIVSHAGYSLVDEVESRLPAGTPLDLSALTESPVPKMRIEFDDSTRE